MSAKRIEEFVDQEGQSYWLEPDTLKDHELPSTMLSVISANGADHVTVKYDLTYHEGTHSIAMVAHTTIGSQRIRGNSVHITANAFVQELYSSYKAKDTFSNRKLIVDARNKAIEGLSSVAFETYNYIFNDLHLNCYGEVLYDGDVIGIFDKSIITKSKAELSKMEITVPQLYTNIDIIKDKNPEVRIATDTGKLITFMPREITVESKGILSNYSFRMDISDSIDIRSENRYQELIPITNDFSDDSPWINERKSKLSDGTEMESEIDTRFDDFFDF